jgi:predicted transposase/invertase (TIGR01784 family)
MDLNNVHDKFFKDAFSYPEVVKAFLQRVLRPSIVSILDLANLRYAQVSYITPELKEAFADLVIEVDVIGIEVDLQISILLEHKSYKDEYAILQLDEYLIKGYQHQLKNGKKLSLILPILYYHGEQDWDMKGLDYFMIQYPESLRQYIPSHKSEFVSLKNMRDTDIDQFENEMLISSILVQKYRNDPNKIFESLFRIFETLSPYIKRNFMKSIIVYSGTTSLKREDLPSLINSLLKNKQEEDMITLAEQLIQEGMEKGIEKGVAKGKIEATTQMILAMHDDKFTIDKIVNYAKLEVEEIINILKNNGRLV